MSVSMSLPLARKLLLLMSISLCFTKMLSVLKLKRSWPGRRDINKKKGDHQLPRIYFMCMVY